MKLGRCSTVAIRPTTLVLAILTFAAVLDSVVDAKTPNKPVEGVLNSGYFFPKVLLWHSVRTSLGRYWLAYSTWLFGFVFRCTYLKIQTKAEGNRRTFEWATAFARFGDYITGLALLFSSVVSATIADVSVIYLAGLCYIQTFIEAARADGIIKHSNPQNLIEKVIEIWLLNWALGAASVLATSYRPLDIHSAVYFVFNIVIIAPFAVAANFGGKEGRDSSGFFTRLKKVVVSDTFGEINESYINGNRRCYGMVASIVQFAFCTWSFILTYQIDDVLRAMTITLYTTTAVLFIMSSCAHTCSD